MATILKEFVMLRYLAHVIDKYLLYATGNHVDLFCFLHFAIIIYVTAVLTLRIQTALI